MGEIINLKDISTIMLWSDSDVAYKVKSYKLIQEENPCVEVVLNRIKPFPHLIDDSWTFAAIVDKNGTVKVDLDFYTQNQPRDDD